VIKISHIVNFYKYLIIELHLFGLFDTKLLLKKSKQQQKE